MSGQFSTLLDIWEEACQKVGQYCFCPAAQLWEYLYCTAHPFKNSKKNMFLKLSLSNFNWQNASSHLYLDCLLTCNLSSMNESAVTEQTNVQSLKRSNFWWKRKDLGKMVREALPAWYSNNEAPSQTKVPANGLTFSTPRQLIARLSPHK